MKTYSWKKGFWKFITGIATAGLFMSSFAGFADFKLWEVLTIYVKPIIGAMTVGGLFTWVINYAKFKRSMIS